MKKGARNQDRSKSARTTEFSTKNAARTRYVQQELNCEPLDQHFGQPRMLQELRYVHQEPNHNPLFQRRIDLHSSSEEDEIPMLMEDRLMVRYP